MQHLKIFTSKGLLIIVLISCIFCACKKEEVFRPGIPKGTRFRNLTVDGFMLDSVQLRVGPRSILAGYLFEEISANTFIIPFDSMQTLNRVVLYQKDGSKPFQGSQFKFDNRYKDTSVKVFYDGKTLAYNPVPPVPSGENMLLRVTFKSMASNYRGHVDLELHDAYLKTFKRPVIVNGDTVRDDSGDIKYQNYDSILVAAPIKTLIKNVKRTEFTDYVELTKPQTSQSIGYAFYVRLPGQTTGINYPKGLKLPEWDLILYEPAYTLLLAIKDNKLETEIPNRIEYKTTNVSQYVY